MSVLTKKITDWPHGSVLAIVLVCVCGEDNCGGRVCTLSAWSFVVYFLCPCSERLKFPSTIDDCKRNCGLLTLMARVFREQTGIDAAAFLSLVI